MIKIEMLGEKIRQEEELRLRGSGVVNKRRKVYHKSSKKKKKMIFDFSDASKEKNRFKQTDTMCFSGSTLSNSVLPEDIDLTLYDLTAGSSLETTEVIEISNLNHIRSVEDKSKRGGVQSELETNMVDADADTDTESDATENHEAEFLSACGEHFDTPSAEPQEESGHAKDPILNIQDQCDRLKNRKEQSLRLINEINEANFTVKWQPYMNGYSMDSIMILDDCRAMKFNLENLSLTVKERTEAKNKNQEMFTINYDTECAQRRDLHYSRLHLFDENNQNLTFLSN